MQMRMGDGRTNEVVDPAAAVPPESWLWLTNCDGIMRSSWSTSKLTSLLVLECSARHALLHSLAARSVIQVVADRWTDGRISAASSSSQLRTGQKHNAVQFNDAAIDRLMSTCHTHTHTHTWRKEGQQQPLQPLYRNILAACLKLAAADRPVGGEGQGPWHAVR